MGTEDELDDIKAGVVLRTYFTDWPLSRELMTALATAANFTLLKNYEPHKLASGQESRAMKLLVDPNSAESTENAASLARTEMLAGTQARKGLEELAVATAGTLRDQFKQNPALSEAVKVPRHVLYFQEREIAAVKEAATIASHEVVLKQEMYADVTHVIVELVARKAVDILARKPEVLRCYEQYLGDKVTRQKGSWLIALRQNVRKLFD